VVEEADDGSFLLTRIDVMAPVCAAPSLRAQRFIAPDEPAPASLNPELAAQTTARIPDRTRCRSSRFSPASPRTRAQPPPRHLLATRLNRLVERIEQPLRILDPLGNVGPPFVLSALLDAAPGSQQLTVQPVRGGNALLER
jgi:hypothetical protein